MRQIFLIVLMLLLAGCMATQPPPQQPVAEHPTAREARLDRVSASLRRMCINSGHRPDTAEYFECYARLAAIYTAGPNAVPPRR